MCSVLNFPPIVASCVHILLRIAFMLEIAQPLFSRLLLVLVGLGSLRAEGAAVDELGRAASAHYLRRITWRVHYPRMRVLNFSWPIALHFRGIALETTALAASGGSLSIQLSHIVKRLLVPH
jgi:hypothetical protein